MKKEVTKKHHEPEEQKPEAEWKKERELYMVFFIFLSILL